MAMADGVCGVLTPLARSIIMIVFGFLLIFIPPCVIKDYHLGSGLRGKGRLTIKPTGIIHNTENKLFALRLPNNTPQGPRKRAAVLMGARTPPRCRRAARRRSRGRGRHAVRARRVSRAAFGSSPFAPAVWDAVRAAIRARVAPPYTGLAGWRPTSPCVPRTVNAAS